MQYFIYVMRDQRTCYLTPTFDRNNFSATRNFESALKQSQGILHTHPEDFSLYCIGSYDDATGTITPNDPYIVCDGKSFVEE